MNIHTYTHIRYLGHRLMFNSEGDVISCNTRLINTAFNYCYECSLFQNNGPSTGKVSGPSFMLKKKINDITELANSYTVYNKLNKLQVCSLCSNGHLKGCEW